MKLYYCTSLSYIGKSTLEHETSREDYLGHEHFGNKIVVTYRSSDDAYMFTPDENEKYGCITEDTIFYTDLDELKTMIIRHTEETIAKIRKRIDDIRNYTDDTL
jgi:hypothetical protein